MSGPDVSDAARVDGQMSDATPLPGDAMADADAGLVVDSGVPLPDEAVRIRVLLREIDLEGTTESRVDTSGWTASVVLDGARTRRVRGSLDGEIRGLVAPPGPRDVLIERPGRPPVLVVGTSTIIELVETVVGREAPIATETTSVAIRVEGLRPWSDDSSLEMASAATSPFDPLLWIPHSDGWPRRGATRADPPPMSWRGLRLLEGRAGDDLVVARRDPVAGGYAVTELGRVEDVTVVPGVLNTFTTTMAPVVRDVPVDFVCRGEEEFGASDVHASAMQLNVWGSVGIQLAGTETFSSAFVRRAQLSLLISRTERPGGHPDEVIVRGEVMRPLHGYSTYATCSAFAFVELTGLGSLPVTLGRWVPFEAAARTGSVLVRLLPPIDVTINGVASTDALRDVGAEPVLGWQASARGARAAGYAVQVYRVDGPDRTLVGELYTSGTSVRVAPGMLARGFRYFALITAVDGADLARKSRAAWHAESWATATSDAFFP